MRIAIVLKTFPPDVIGGMETQTKRLATELQDAGHDVTVFTKRYGDQDDSDVPYEVARVRHWQLNPFVSDLMFLVFTLLALLHRKQESDRPLHMVIERISDIEGANLRIAAMYSRSKPITAAS